MRGSSDSSANVLFRPGISNWSWDNVKQSRVQKANQVPLIHNPPGYYYKTLANSENWPIRPFRERLPQKENGGESVKNFYFFTTQR